jgi:hypothetical protein
VHVLARTIQHRFKTKFRALGTLLFAGVLSHRSNLGPENFMPCLFLCPLGILDENHPHHYIFKAAKEMTPPSRVGHRQDRFHARRLCLALPEFSEEATNGRTQKNDGPQGFSVLRKPHTQSSVSWVLPGVACSPTSSCLCAGESPNSTVEVSKPLDRNDHQARTPEREWLHSQNGFGMST